MKRLTIAFATAFLSASVFATAQPPAPTPPAPAPTPVKQDQGQAQLQGQAQSQNTKVGVSSKNSNKNSNSNSNSNKNVNANKNSNSNSNKNVNANKNANTNANNASVNNQVTITSPGHTVTEVTGTTKIKNVPNVDAPALTSSNDTCMGSTSAGGSGPGFGVSVGTTWTDNNCKMLKNSRELWNMGMRGAAMALMCNDPLNKEALEMTGYTCPQTERDRSKAAAQNVTPTNDTQYTDPYIRMRLGQPPLAK